MKIEQKKFSISRGWEIVRDGNVQRDLYNLVFVFGSVRILGDPGIYDLIRKDYPQAHILMASTAGEIIDTQVNDDTISLTAVFFERTIIKTAVINAGSNSYESGCLLAHQFEKENLTSVFVISDGQKVNGSDLVHGLQDCLPQGVILTGGLAGDGSRFKTTLVGLDETAKEGRVAAVAFYGQQLSVTFGSMGGWSSFGPERAITRSEKNILYEMDRLPALDIYKQYLGEYASELPGSALLFPLSIRNEHSGYSIVRTILNVNEGDQSLIFAGNMPQGSYARLMMANIDRLIEGASSAAVNSMDNTTGSPDLAILISCVGRKLVLGQRSEEEVEAVRAVYDTKTAIAGFYSYGEISPSSDLVHCELHNQTMTITTMTEI